MEIKPLLLGLLRSRYVLGAQSNHAKTVILLL